jgi:hypothetical protein
MKSMKTDWEAEDRKLDGMRKMHMRGAQSLADVARAQGVTVKVYLEWVASRCDTRADRGIR